MAETQDALATLHPAVRDWFARNFGAPSPPQAMGWPAVAAGRSVLILAPTGSGKTLAAFLQCLSRLYEGLEAGDALDDGVRVLYVSPLKALNNDIHKNLELPLAGITEEASRLGLSLPPLCAAVRTGDTSPAERRLIAKRPPQILITTPESLAIMLASGAREILRRVSYVIVDEIHALYGNKRGVHLSLSLEHLAAITARPFQRIGLSATMRPLAEAAAFLGGGEAGPGGEWRPRPVEIVDTGQRKELDLRILLPVDDLRSLPEKTIWPSIQQKLLELVREHRSTLVFVNNRRLAERLTAKLNDLAGATVAMTHHGSLAKERRLEVEQKLKSGGLQCLVATSSLELGIDVGAIDLVVQVESPKEVARGLQRVGRAGHLAGLASKGRVIPKTQSDLLDCAAIVREMRTGLVEETRSPENCLDVLAQQLVGLVCMGERGAGELYDIARRAYPYRRLPRAQFDRTLAMLAGEYGSERFAGLRPRLYWDRVNDLVRAADRGRRLYYTSGGTIPDRGYFGVHLAGSGARLGEVEEEFVAERRLWDRFILGTSAWRIEEIRRDRLIVTPAGPGDAMVPFWKGETAGRPFELGRRIGAFLEELGARLQDPDFEDWVARECLMDKKAAANLRAHLAAQVESTGCLPSDRRLVIEEFQDELGEWRVMLHSPFGARVHAPLALLLQEQLLARDGLEAEVMHDDSGILFHCSGAPAPPRLDPAALPAAGLEEALAAAVRGTTLFALLFRHNAARALLLPKGPYGRKRTPLWLARLRAADLLQAVSDCPDFPIVLETMRECLNQAFDADGLRFVLTGLRDGSITVHRCRNQRPSPFSRGLQFSFFGAYMYVPDLPKGERRFRALGLPREALRELLGAEDVRGLLDPEAIAAVTAEAAGLAGGCLPRGADELHAWLRGGRELDEGPAPIAGAGDAGTFHPLLAELRAARRAALVSWPAGGTAIRAWVAAEDLPLYLAALPACRPLEPEALPPQNPMDPAEARRWLVRRYSRTHGPFTLDELLARYGLARDAVEAALAVLQAEGLVQQGEFSPGVTVPEWCDVDLLQRIHRRSLARARREIEPRGAAEYAAFLARWQGVANPGYGPQALADVLERFAGLWLPAGAWGGGVLPARVRDYRPAMLERLVGGGQYVWMAHGRGAEMRLSFTPPGRETDPIAAGAPPRNLSQAAAAVWEALRDRGALFLTQIVQRTGLDPDAVLAALESLAGDGLATNDTLGPVGFFAQRHPRGRHYVLTQPVLAGMGRWSLLAPEQPPAAGDAAEILLRRYGLVTRDLAARDGFSWEGLLPVYERLEAIGRIRRGYFVEGLGGLQYALPEAVERLRLPLGEGPPVYWALLWKDPANPYGSLLPLPGGQPGIQPDLVVFNRGEPALAGGGRKLRLASLGGGESREEDLAETLRTFVAAAAWGGGKRIVVAEFDGRPVLETPAAEILKGLGFEKGYRQMVKWQAS
ncbi:MAG: DEAD/DEAH box helicase [Patescibacteria group bacterium]